MVDSIQGNLPKFTTIKYVTKDGENCQATKNNGVVTVVGDKNGVRQLPQDEFMKEFVQTLPNVNLEKTPKADTVAFSGQGEEIAEEDNKKGTSKGMLATVAVLGTALIGAGIWLLSKGKTGAKIGEAVGQAADAIKPAAEKAETVVRETAEAVGNSVKEVTTKAQETIKPAVEKAEAVVRETAEKVTENAKPVVETVEEKAKGSMEKVRDAARRMHEKAGKKTSAPKSEAKPKAGKKPSTPKTEVKPEVKVEMPKADKKPYQKPEIKVETKPAEVKPAEIKPAKTNVTEEIAETLDDAATAAIIMEGAPHGAKAAGKVAEETSQLSDDIAKAAEELFSGNSGKTTTFVDKLEAPVDEVVGEVSHKPTTFVDKLEAPVDEVVGEVSRKPTTFVDKLENPIDDVATLHKPTTFVDDLEAPVDDLATLHTPTFTDGLNNPVDDILTNGSMVDDIGSTLDSGLGHIDDLVDGVDDFFDGIL